jgi:predicted small lipoprotein YifL
MILIAAAVIASSLAACGRKGDLLAPPGDEDSDFPRPYPAATVP